MRRAFFSILGIAFLGTNPATAGFVTKPWGMSIASQYVAGGGNSSPVISLHGSTPLTLPETTYAPGRGTISTSVQAGTDYSDSTYQPAATLDGHVSVGGYDPSVTTYSSMELGITSQIQTTLQPPISQQEANGRIVFQSSFSITGHLAEGDILMFIVNSHAETKTSGGGIQGIMDYSPTRSPATPWQTINQAGDFSFTFIDTRVISGTYQWWATNNNIAHTWYVSANVDVVIYHHNGPGTTSVTIDPGVTIRNSAMVPEPASLVLSALGCAGLACVGRIRPRRPRHASRGGHNPA